MRTAADRTAAYDAKTQGSVLGARMDAYRKHQAGNFTVSVGDQVNTENLVRSVLTENAVMVGLHHYYMDFGKKLLQLKRKYSGGTLYEEVCNHRDMWDSRGLSLPVLDEIIVRFGLHPCFIPPAPCSWLYKRTITFSGNISGTNLDDFPVLVRLTAANFDFSHAQAHGEDLRFMDSDVCPDLSAPLPHEFEYWNQAIQEGYVWVKVPRIDGGSVTDKIYMYFGNAAAPDGQDRHAVWSNNYEAVWHMKGYGTGFLVESTANGFSMAEHGSGSPWDISGGQVDGAQDTKNSNMYMDNYPVLDSIPPAVTFSYWFKPYATRTPASGGHLFHFSKWFGFSSQEVLECWFFDGTGTIWWYATSGVGSCSPHLASTTTTWLNTHWYHIQLTAGPAGMFLYVDGVLESSNSGYTCMPVTGSGNRMTIACQANGGGQCQGGYDEFRVSRVQRSDDWIKASHLSETDALATYGPETPA